MDSLLEEGIKEQKEFLKNWPIERLEKMTLDEYTNLDTETAFVYWLKKRTEDTGGIWGGSAYKFGIYRRRNTGVQINDEWKKTDGVYAWFKKYGETRDTAFNSVKNIILQISKASRENNFHLIDNLDLVDSVKWKIAFLYNVNGLLQIFKKEEYLFKVII